MNARYSGSKVAKDTLLINPYKIFKNYSNEHGCYLKIYWYSNIQIIQVQSPTNLSKSMWKLIYNVVNVIFWFGSLKKETHKVQKNNAPSKNFKKMFLGQKIWKANKNYNSYGLIKIWLYFNHSKVLNYWMVYVFKEKILHMSWSNYILNLNNKFGMWINIKFSILWCSNQTISPYFVTSKVQNY